jgi:hypothetical protein
VIVVQRWAGLLLCLGVVLAACAPAPTPAPLSNDAACAAAWRQYRAELSAAAENCLSDEGCVAFGSCFAVTRGQVAALQDLQGQAKRACALVEGSHVDVECGPRPARCVARRCVRF